MFKLYKNKDVTGYYDERESFFYSSTKIPSAIKGKINKELGKQHFFEVPQEEFKRIVDQLTNGVEENTNDISEEIADNIVEFNMPERLASLSPFHPDRVKWLWNTDKREFSRYYNISTEKLKIKYALN